MKNNGKYIVGLIILILVLVFGAGIIIVNRSSTARRIQVVYIPKARDDANDFWTSLLKGAQMAANEYDVDLTILAPDSEQDFEAQVRYIDEAIAMNPNAIILSPSSKSEITEAANRIVVAGIRLVLIDSELDQNLQSIVVETDNVAAGRKMGEFILTHLPENPVIGVVSHVKSSSTAQERYQGLCEGLGDEKEHIVGTVYCDSNYEKAYNRTKALLEEHPDINILVGLNEYSAIGAGKAVRDLGLSDSILMVGFDSSIEEVQMLEEGVFNAIIVQKPFNMGYLGVENTVLLLRGEILPEMVDSGSELITKENMYTDENQKFLVPFLD